MDIEDLVKFGQDFHSCPYYLSRDGLQDADIILLPYQYLLDAKTRKSQNISLQNAIVILDEAHNVVKSCEDAVSYELTSLQLTGCITELQVFISFISRGLLILVCFIILSLPLYIRSWSYIYP